MEKMFYSISQAAEMVGENATTVRFWSNRFSKFINPRRNAKGNRLFHPEDIEVLRRISRYTREGGLSLDAVERKLRHGDSSDGEKMQMVSESLKRIREQLVQIRETL